MSLFIGTYNSLINTLLASCLYKSSFFTQNKKLATLPLLRVTSLYNTQT